MSQFDTEEDGKKSCENGDRWAPSPDKPWRKSRRRGVILFHSERVFGGAETDCPGGNPSAAFEDALNPAYDAFLSILQACECRALHELHSF